MSNEADINLNKTNIKVTQKANFPWDGNVEISVDPETPANFEVRLRIPGWARNEAIPGGLYKFSDQKNETYTIAVNGEVLIPEIVNGYAIIAGKWQSGDRISLELPMPVRTVVADERIKDDIGKMAVQRGPVIYCAEWPDIDLGQVLNLVVSEEADFTTEYQPGLLNGTQVIKTKGKHTHRTLEGKIEVSEETDITLIPYALWNNRGPGQMMVWLPATPEAAKSLELQ